MKKIRRVPKDVVDEVEYFVPTDFNAMLDRFNTLYWKQVIENMPIRIVAKIVKYEQSGNWNPFLYHHAQCRLGTQYGMPHDFPTILQHLMQMVQVLLTDSRYYLGTADETDKYITYYRRYHGDKYNEAIKDTHAT